MMTNLHVSVYVEPLIIVNDKGHDRNKLPPSFDVPNINFLIELNSDNLSIIDENDWSQYVHYLEILLYW